jgi:GNAT superfamily N-acetyltransferase
MRVERCDSPETFLAATAAHRGSEPIRTNVIGSVATTVVVQGPPSGDCFWWVVRDDRGAVVGEAMRTAPWVLSLGPMPREAAHALASEVAAADPGLPGVAGFVSPVEAFLESYEWISGSAPRAVATTQRQLLYEIEQVTVPDVEGEPAVATREELEAVDGWFGAFSSEVEGVAVARTEEDRRQLANTVGDGRVWWWMLEGTRRSMAGHAMPVEGPSGVVTRVGPVYTPPEHRKHGYGGAVTGAVSKVLLDRGSRVMLYTDAANPTSNHVYRTLGYELVDEFVRHSFAGRSHH